MLTKEHLQEIGFTEVSQTDQGFMFTKALHPIFGPLSAQLCVYGDRPTLRPDTIVTMELLLGATLPGDQHETLQSVIPLCRLDASRALTYLPHLVALSTASDEFENIAFDEPGHDESADDEGLANEDWDETIADRILCESEPTDFELLVKSQGHCAACHSPLLTSYYLTMISVNVPPTWLFPAFKQVDDVTVHKAVAFLCDDCTEQGHKLGVTPRINHVIELQDNQLIEHSLESTGGNSYRLLLPTATT